MAKTKTFLFITATIIFLFVLDQKFFLGESKARYNYDDSLLWVLKPNLDKNINSKGFLDFEHKYQKTTDKKRIAIIGDSFMVTIINDSLEKTYPRLLEKMLNENKLDYEVINLGVSGYGTDQELILLQKEGLKYNPDVVILGFYLENDIPDNSKELLIVENGVLIKNEKGLFKIKKYLYKSLLIMKGNSLIFSKFNRFGGSIVHTAISTGIYPHIPYYGGKIFEKEPLKYLDDNLEKTEIILKEIKKICDKNNISLIILMIPSVLEKNSEGNGVAWKLIFSN
ncbi:MAG: SGNH/GDSL hydrolase family protein [Nanoarchaeota archaeon]|nr:SGNH/GDSL hydrolase family protein [Nanoarchaeota archaeon]